MSDERVALNQYLTFTLDGDSFALDIAYVREILDLIPITRIPRAPEFMRGVINLRGRAVPVVDLRIKFGMGAAERTVNACVIIVEVEADGERLAVGALADSVQEVFEIEPANVEAPPRMGARVRTEFIRGVSRRDDRFLIILDANRVFSADELEMLKADAAPGQEAA